jgi:hypothetical protein
MGYIGLFGLGCVGGVRFTGSPCALVILLGCSESFTKEHSLMAMDADWIEGNPVHAVLGFGRLQFCWPVSTRLGCIPWLLGGVTTEPWCSYCHCMSAYPMFCVPLMQLLARNLWVIWDNITPLFIGLGIWRSTKWPRGCASRVAWCYYLLVLCLVPQVPVGGPSSISNLKWSWMRLAGDESKNLGLKLSLIGESRVFIGVVNSMG